MPTHPSRNRMFSSILTAMLLAVSMAGVTFAQFRLPTNLGSGLGGQPSTGEPVAVSAQFTRATADRPAVLMVTAKIAPGWYMYSLTQPAGGPQKTRIELAPSHDYRILGPFQPNQPFQTHVDREVWVGLELQEHKGTVTWYAAIELAEGVDPEQLQVAGTLVGQACQEACIPIKLPFSAELGPGVPIGELTLHETPPSFSAADQPSTFKLPDSSVVVSGQVAPGVVSPGSSVKVTFTLAPPENWHVYALGDEVPTVGTRPTLIAFSPQSQFEIERPSTTSEIVEQDQAEIGWDVARFHKGDVSWTVTVHVPKDTPQGGYSLAGILGYQACEDGQVGEGSCEVAKGVRFDVPIFVGATDSSSPAPVRFAAASYADAANLVEGSATLAAVAEYDLGNVVVGETAAIDSIWHYVVLAFVGGIILNLMPCVLPVIGLKVMSFVEQAGKSRAHAFALNLWYSAGIIAVFLVLAALAITAGLSWGGQFGNTAFNITLTALVFAMALSLLGVWEIPIPGFLGTGTAQELAQQEGPLGAFLKGAITTVLATPCTGPFMAPAIGWAVAQSPATTLTVFTSLGVGMASPYLLIGAFPSLIRFLPKPGSWMVTFKQLMGFVLLATVVFLLSFMEQAAIVPTIAFLLGIGLACWTVSRTPLTAEFRQRMESWLTAAAVVLLAGVISFAWLYQKGGGTTWPAFSLVALHEAAVEQGQTVLVDFSADWCLTCKTLEKAVLHTKPVERALNDAGVVTMYGDFTDYPDEIDRTIRALGANGVPVIAIFPGGDPYRPIVFRGAYTQSDLLAAIQQASDRRPARPIAQANAAERAGLN